MYIYIYIVTLNSNFLVLISKNTSYKDGNRISMRVLVFKPREKGDSYKRQLDY